MTVAGPSGSLVLPHRSVGIMGELRISPDDIPAIDKALLYADLLDRSEHGWFVTRSHRYYSPLNVSSAYEEAATYLTMLSDTACHAESCGLPSAYILADYALNRLVRVVAAIPSEHPDSQQLSRQLSGAIDACARVIVDSLTGRHFSQPQAPLIPDMASDLGGLPTRGMVDGDNHAMTLVAVQGLSQDIGHVVGVLLGGGAAAPIAAVQVNARWSYTKVSVYDEPTDGSGLVGTSQRRVDGLCLILDDNCGTGQTLKRTKTMLAHTLGIDPWQFAVELHWEKLLRVIAYHHGDAVFNPADVRHPSPWCYRHHHLLRSLARDASQRRYKSSLDIHDWAEYSAGVLRVLREAVRGDVAKRILIDSAADRAKRLARVTANRRYDGIATLTRECWYRQ